MKKIITFFTLTLIFIISAATLYVDGSVPKTLRVNYYRYDENYTNYSIWLWEYMPEGKGGISHDFSSSRIGEYGAYIDIDLDEQYPGATVLGVIVKKGNWESREPGGDRYINLTNAEVKNGVVNAYIVEQDLNIGISTADLENNTPDYRATILSAAFTVDKDSKPTSIGVTFTEIPTSYKVLENGNVIWTSTSPKRSDQIPVTSVDILNRYEVIAIFDESREVTREVSIEKLYDTPDFINSFTYNGELGVILNANKTTFRLWAPVSSKVTLNLYNQGHAFYNNMGRANLEETPYQTIDLVKIEHGAWETVVDSNLAGKYYTFSVTNGNVTNEVTDPYAYSTGANGTRGLIVDFNQANPVNWQYNSRPDTIQNNTDYIVYELHVRDLTSSNTWTGTEENRGKFLGLIEEGTTYTSSRNNVTVSTGFDHILDLGVNAIQLLPIFDFGYVDEIQASLNPVYPNIFNWGYMPYHFNTLEGSYSSNPFDGLSRVNEFKQVVQKFHDNDIRIIMDVVYNHTGESESSNFHKILPSYYHRMNQDGGFSNGSGTGNETASERSMMRKFMIDSLVFLTKEYNLSGFRFDLMALHDTETMRQIETALEAIDPTIVIYGEPWSGGDSPLPGNQQAGKQTLTSIGDVGAFNDSTRDAIKGSTFDANSGGFVQGNVNDETINNIKYGIVGGINHPQVNYGSWHGKPTKTVNYVEAHDNHTLHDKLRLSGASAQTVGNFSIQANAMILTSQGIPFLHAGAEILRSKPVAGATGNNRYDHNSYESPDAVNQIRWDAKVTNLEVFEYYKTLISIRKNYPQFRMSTAQEIVSRLSFIDTGSIDTVAFKIEGTATQAEIIVIHSGHNKRVGFISVPLTPGKNYHILTTFEDHNINGLETISDTAYVVNSSTMVLVEERASAHSVKRATLEIDKGSTFNPLSNINYNSTLYNTMTASSYYDVNTPGYYAITVRMVSTDGQVSLLYYTLKVKGTKFRVNLGGLL